MSNNIIINNSSGNTFLEDNNKEINIRNSFNKQKIKVLFINITVFHQLMILMNLKKLKKK